MGVRRIKERIKGLNARSMALAGLISLMLLGLSLTSKAQSDEIDSGGQESCHLLLSITERRYGGNIVSFELAGHTALVGDMSASVMAPETGSETIISLRDGGDNLLGSYQFFPATLKQGDSVISAPLWAEIGELQQQAKLLVTIPYVAEMRAVELLSPEGVVSLPLNAATIVCPNECLGPGERGLFGPDHCCNGAPPSDLGGGRFICSG